MAIWRWFSDEEDSYMVPIGEHEVPDYEVEYIASQINSWVQDEKELRSLMRVLEDAVRKKL